ncbi:MAG: P-loop NTPase [Desulfovibrionaceae bacterium]
MSDACKSCPSSTPGGGCSSGGTPGECAGPGEDKLQKAISRIKNKVVVLSGKGGVGKSTVATNLAVALSLSGLKVGLLDVDVHGPSVPRLLSLTGSTPHIEANFMEPVPYSDQLWVMSLGFMIPDADQAVVWRGPVKMGLIRQFLEDVAWGDLDVLVVDCPPGTGDEPLSVLQLLGKEAQAVIVTTPQGVAVDDVRRSVGFVRELENPLLGIVENMSGFVCPDCGKEYEIFGKGGGEALARLTGAPFLGRVPIDPELVRSMDQGYPLVKVDRESPSAKALWAVADTVKGQLKA